MIAYSLKRLGFAIVTLFLVLTCVFILVRIIPGDPAMVVVGEQASKVGDRRGAGAAGSRSADSGAISPVHAQILRGDLGNSMITNRPVIQEIANVLP